jgi:hypothetical protein
MSDRSLHWLACDTPGCTTESRDLAKADDAEADSAAIEAGWSHYTIGNDPHPYDVCPECLASRPDLAAKCALEEYEGF